MKNIITIQKNVKEKTLKFLITKLKEERIKTLEEVKEKIIEELDMYEIIIKDMRDKEYDGKQIITALINNIKN
jgi:hypothetical protein